MSQPAICAGVPGLPKPYCSGAASAGTAAASSIALKNLDIAHFAARLDAPGLDRVVVVDGARSAHFAQLADRRLHVARVVHRPRLQERSLAVPGPVDAETRERLAQHGRLQPRAAPVAAAVDRCG